MKAVYRAALMVAAFVFLLPLSARSEIRAGSFELSPFAGYNFFEDDQNLEDDFIFGGRLGYNFTRRFGIEAVGEFINTNVDDKTKTGEKEGEYPGTMDGVDLTFYHLDAVYHIMPDGKFNPFVAAGFGFVHSSPSISTDDMAAFNVGVGAKYWFTDNIAFRVDVRDYMVTEIFQETFHNIGVTLGITIAFGGKAKPARAQVAKYDTTPAPMAAEPVVILASEPKAEEKVIALVSEPKIEDKIIVLALEDIHFDFDKSTLTPEAQTILKRNIRILKDNPKAKIRIAGYTSASGTKEYNQTLSEKRANAVEAYLVNEGVITSDRLSTIGYGEMRPAMVEPIPENIYSEAAKANMRVLFEIIVR